MGNSCEEGFFLVDSHVGAVRDGPGRVGCLVIVALSVDSSVGVSCLEGQSVVLDVVEGEVHESTLTSMVSVAG